MEYIVPTYNPLVQLSYEYFTDTTMLMSEYLKERSRYPNVELIEGTVVELKYLNYYVSDFNLNLKINRVIYEVCTINIGASISDVLEEIKNELVYFLEFELTVNIVNQITQSVYGMYIGEIIPTLGTSSIIGQWINGLICIGYEF